MSYQDTHPYLTEIVKLQAIVDLYRELFPNSRITEENFSGFIKIMITITNGHSHFSLNNHNYRKILMVDVMHYVIQQEYKRSLLSTPEVTVLHSIVEKELDRYEWEDKMVLCFLSC
jgi:hypothetical protein